MLKAEEKQFEELISLVPTQDLLITHFGNGDETDQDVLHQLLTEKATSLGGSLKRLTIFPGKSHGHCLLDSADTAEKLMRPNAEGGLLDCANCADVEFPGTLAPNRVVALFYSKLRLEQRSDHANVEVPTASIAVTGAIPGLYVYKDFITPEEEQ